MRIVLDTNVLISGFFWGGPPRQVLDAARSGRVELFTSPTLLAELHEVLQRPKFADRLRQVGVSAEQLVSDYQQLAVTVQDREFSLPFVRDVDDIVVLACALEANATVIVSGDLDLLVLESAAGVSILTATQLLKLL